MKGMDIEESEDIDINAISDRLLDVRASISGHNKKIDELKLIKDELESKIIKWIRDTKLDTIKIKGKVTLTVTEKSFPSIVDEEKFRAFLRKINQEEIGNWTVNPKTLQAWWTNNQEDPEFDKALTSYTKDNKVIKGLVEATEELSKENKIGLSVYKKDSLSVRQSK